MLAPYILTALIETPQRLVYLSSGMQGIALMLLAQRLGDANRARLAVQQIEVASVTMRDHGNAALASDYNRQAFKAQAVLRQLSMR